MEIELWTLFDALMKWVIIPLAAVLWVHNQKLGSHEKEVLRIMTLLAERKDQRDEDRAELKEALRDLRAAILRLDQRLADFALNSRWPRRRRDPPLRGASRAEPHATHTAQPQPTQPSPSHPRRVLSF